MATTLLLICGPLASLLYLAADLLGGLLWPAYSHAAQGVSELLAAGAPSRLPVLAVMTVRTGLVLGMAAGLWRAAGGHLALRAVAALLCAEALVGQATATLFPVPLRGDSGSGTAHAAGTAVESLLILGAMGCAAALGGRFRAYSIATMLAMLGSGTLAASEIGRIVAGEPTPWLGTAERIGIYAYLLWMAALAVFVRRRVGPRQ